MRLIPRGGVTYEKCDENGKEYCGTLTESVVNTWYSSLSFTILKLREGALIDHRDIVIARSWASTSKRQRTPQVYDYNDL